MSNDTRAALASWLHEQLPPYARGFVQTVPIDGGMAQEVHIEWEHLIGHDSMMFSSGERAAVALAGHLEDRVGVANAMYADDGGPPSILHLLACIPQGHRQRFLSLLRLHLVELVG